LVTTLYNTIVAGNSQQTGLSTPLPNDIIGTLSTISANNLIGEGNGETGITNGSNGNLVGQLNALIDPNLAPLGN
jgi:hypothetical protein